MRQESDFISRLIIISMGSLFALLIFDISLAFTEETQKLRVNIVRKSGQELSLVVDADFSLKVRHGAINDMEVYMKYVDSIEQTFPNGSGDGILAVNLIDGSSLLGPTRGDSTLGGYSIEFIKEAKVIHQHKVKVPVKDKNILLEDQTGNTFKFHLKDMEFEFYLISNKKEIGIIKIPSFSMIHELKLKENSEGTYSIIFSDHKAVEGRPMNYGVGWEYGSLPLSFREGPNRLVLLRNIGEQTPLPPLSPGPKDRIFQIEGVPFEMWSLRKYNTYFRETARSGTVKWGQTIHSENTTIVLMGQPPKEIDMNNMSNIFVEDKYNATITLKNKDTIKGRIVNIDYFSAMTPFGRIRMGLSKLQRNTIYFQD